jgi:uncharacterized protein YdeI (YjbR/CyaY-like superfamily)
VVGEPLEFADADAWETWIERNQGAATEAWLRIGKRNAGTGLIGIEAALDSALCFGWIDGQRRGGDTVSFLQRYTPRRPRSAWSAVNVAHVERLTAEGRMRPAGIAQVEAARADGRWDAAYPPQRDGHVPDDVTASLRDTPGAEAAFEALGRTECFVRLLAVHKARTPEGRARAIARLVRDLITPT